MKLYLTVIRNGCARTFTLARESATLGRAADCDLVIDDIALSRMHCRFEQVDGEVFVRDMNSRNGTYLRGVPVGRARLSRGDEIRAGNIVVRFDGTDAASGFKSLASRTIPLFGFRRTPRTDKRDVLDENRRLKQLPSLLRSLAEESDSGRLFSRIMDMAIELAVAERGFLILFDSEGASVEVARNYWRADVSDPEFEFSRSIAEQVRAEQRGLLVDDAEADVRLKEFLSVHALKLRSVLCVPLRIGGEVDGVLYLDNRFSRGSFTEADLDLMEPFADLAAIALRNCDRSERERRRANSLAEEIARKGEELTRVRRALDAKEQAEALRYSYGGIVADSPAMGRLLRLADRLTGSAIPLVLEGEAGSGKESLARLIHRNGPRGSRPFVAISCAALPEGLAEVELFGHGPGAFTGAASPRGGILEEADGGTLYLDGLPDLHPDVQALFLRVLETGEYRPLGDSRCRRADVRVVAGTGTPIDALLRDGIVRPDLVFRLRGAVLRVPSLRERPEDMPRILAAMIEREAPRLQLTPAARRALLMRPWPGNLIELRNEIRRLGTLDPRPVDVGDLGPVEPAAGRTLKEAVADLEKRMILRTLQASAGNLSKAARKLGLSRLGLRNKLLRYGLGGAGDAPSGN